MTTPTGILVTIPVDHQRRLTAEIRSSADGKYAVTITRWADGRQLERPVTVPAVTSSRIDALATAVTLALSDR